MYTILSMSPKFIFLHVHFTFCATPVAHNAEMITEKYMLCMYYPSIFVADIAHWCNVIYDVTDGVTGHQTFRSIKKQPEGPQYIAFLNLYTSMWLPQDSITQV